MTTALVLEPWQRFHDMAVTLIQRIEASPAHSPGGQVVYPEWLHAVEGAFQSALGAVVGSSCFPDGYEEADDEDRDGFLGRVCLVISSTF